jgi:hypothetical protein
VQGFTGELAIHQLHTSDFNHAVALVREKAGGFGIKKNLTHTRIVSGFVSDSL